MSVDHVRFCADKYLKNSYGFRAAASRRDLVGEAHRLLATAGVGDAGETLGVQTVAEDSDEIAFVVGENGIFVVDANRFFPYGAIAGVRSDYKDKQDFQAIDLDLEGGTTVRLRVESGHGKLRDAFAVSSFLGHLLRRLKQDHPAYQPLATRAS
jgi:hypothetical protein